MADKFGLLPLLPFASASEDSESDIPSKDEMLSLLGLDSSIDVPLKPEDLTFSNARTTSWKSRRINNKLSKRRQKIMINWV